MGKTIPDGAGPGVEDFPEPRRLKQLWWLVTVLTATLILGVITIVALLVIRLSSIDAALGLPPAIVLPKGERAEAVTLGASWIAVVTVDAAGQERIRVLDRSTGAPRAVTEIVPAS